MEEFLSSCCQVVKEGAGPVLHVVLGNEACDVDSVVCALTYAYFLSKTSPRAPVVPLLNIRQAELPLRSDVLWLLRRLQLPVERLLFRDQLDLRALQHAGRLRLTLVDHNVLPSSDRDLEGAVVEVIDHHLLEREPTSCPVTVETVGSCATLVTERIFQKAPEILDQQVAHLLYAAVLLDCVNMAPAAGKVTPKDSQVVAALERRFPALPPRGALFQALHDAKVDISGLNTEQMLLKDMKSVTGSLNVAISVLYLSLEDFLRPAALEAELSGFCLKFGFDLLLLMSISFTQDKQPIRELAVFSHSTACREEVSLHLEQACDPALELHPISSPHPHIKAYQQGNSLASRKKLLPLVKVFLQGQATDLLLGDKRLGGGEEEEEEEGRSIPPTPVNSLVEGCPLDHFLSAVSARDLEEKVSKMADRGGD